MSPLNIPWDRYEMRQDKSTRTDGQAVWQAFSAPGTATDAERWTLFAYTYDSAGFITRRRIKFKVAWDSRSTELPE